jgi:hypothetical protein
MEVAKQHVVEAGEHDGCGLHDYCYRYWLFTFREGDTALLARSYDEEPSEVHFLRKEVGGRSACLTQPDVAGALFTAACEHLRRLEGMAVITVLTGQSYVEVPVGRPPSFAEQGE